MNKELLKDIRDVCEQFVCVHCNSGTSIIRTEATFPRFVTILFDDRSIANILYLPKEKNKYRVMYDIMEGNQLIMFMP